MEGFDPQAHWEKIYQAKPLTDVSWYQPVPETSLEFIRQFQVPLDAKIIDVGGGDSLLVDHLLDAGYTDVTVLDISATALARAQERLGERARRVKWIVADAAAFVPTVQYDFWHDRAAFHFLTRERDVRHYLGALRKGLKPDGVLVLGTFSEQGPQKCSGIEIRRYSEVAMTARLKRMFRKVRCLLVDHRTPFDTVQNFLFCSFRKKADLAA